MDEKEFCVLGCHIPIACHMVSRIHGGFFARRRRYPLNQLMLRWLKGAAAKPSLLCGVNI